MATADDLRAIALSLDGTSEAQHVDRRAFRARIIFATLAPDERTANLTLTPDEQEMKCLMLPQAFAPVANKWGQQGWTTVTLDRIGVDDLRAAVEMAYAHAGPRPKKRR